MVVGTNRYSPSTIHHPPSTGFLAMMTDPIADMLTRIRNANAIERPAVEMPATRQKAGVAQVLKDEGFIADYQVGSYATAEDGHKVFEPSDDFSKPKTILRVYLKYGPEG